MTKIYLKMKTYEELQNEVNRLNIVIFVKDKEIITLRNTIKDIKAQLDYLETYSSKEDVFEDMSRRLNNIEDIINKIGEKND